MDREETQKNDEEDEEEENCGKAQTLLVHT